MYLYLLNDKEGAAFMELAAQALKVAGLKTDYKEAGFETYLMELNLPEYKIQEIGFDQSVACFKNSSIQIKRTVIMELCGILNVDREIGKEGKDWIYKLSSFFNLSKAETDRLIKWSNDFSDFLEVGLMYINAKS